MRILHELRVAARSLWQDRTVAVVAVLTLALGIGANTTIFSFLDGIILQPLPYADSGELVSVSSIEPRQRWRPSGVSPADFFDLREQADTFESLAALRFWGLTLTGQGEPEELATALVTPNLFEVLGVEPVLGRGFRSIHGEPGNDRVVLVSHALWQSRFGGERSLVGRSLVLDGEGYRVAGVLPEGFAFPHDEIGLWAPLAFTPESKNSRERRSLQVVGRLADGVGVRQAAAEMRLVADRLANRHPETHEGIGLMVESLHERTVGHVRPIFLMLLAAVGLVLLIACANVASLLVARTTRKRSDLAVHIALGAQRRVLLRRQGAESLLLAILGGGLGLALGYWGVAGLRAVSPPETPRLDQVAVDGGVLFFTALISLGVAVLLGLLPVFQALKTDPRASMAAGTESNAGGRGWARKSLVTLQTALALILMISAGLMVRSIFELQQVDPGFRTDRLAVTQLYLPQSKYAEDHQKQAFFQRLLSRVRALPGVDSAGATSALPMSLDGVDMDRSFTIEGRVQAETGEQRADVRIVTEDYFRTLGIPLLRGQAFDSQNLQDGRRRVLVNDVLAARHWPEESPIGDRLRLGDTEEPFEIVGVVGNVRHYGLEDRPSPEIYLPYTESPVGTMTVVASAAGDPWSLAEEMKSAVYAEDADQPIHRLATMEALVAESFSDRRLTMALLGGFTVLAVVLAAVGLYGVMAYSVAQRRREIGIRLSLGARTQDVLRNVVGRGLKLAGIGLALGVVGAFVVGRGLSALLFGVTASDPLTYVGSVALLGVVALAASYFPARQAAAVDPVITMRE